MKAMAQEYGDREDKCIHSLNHLLNMYYMPGTGSAWIKNNPRGFKKFGLVWATKVDQQLCKSYVLDFVVAQVELREQL